MRSLARLLMVVIVAAWPGISYAGELFVSEALMFEVEFPAKPQLKSSSRTFTSGDAKIFRYKSIGKRSRPALTVIVFSRDKFTPEEISAALDLSGRRQAAQLKGSIISQNDLSVGGFQGKETVIEGNNQGRTFFYRAQTFYAGNRQYLLSVAAKTLEGVGTQADDFFASLKLMR